MEFLDEDLRLRIIQLTWRNPAFMAIAIALIWLIPQLLIRKIMSEQYEKNKLEKQKQKIKKLYPETLKQIIVLLKYFLYYNIIFFIYEMAYFLKRFDGKEDIYTNKKFITYDEAYIFLEKIIGKTCCSDTDFENNFYYDITEVN